MLKHCPKCDISKPPEGFYAGGRRICKACEQEYAKRKYSLDKVKRKKAAIEWHRNNPASVRAATNKWRAKNVEKVRMWNRLDGVRRRDVKRQKFNGNISELFELQQGLCVVCRVSLGNGYHIDHITPLKRGGTNDIHNLQLLCISCNCQKSASDPVVFMQSRGFLI